MDSGRNSPNMTAEIPVFDFEAFLKSDDFASLNTVNKRSTAIQRTSGSLSTIASICIIVHILRSHHGLSTTYHRLAFGLAIGDIFFSFFGLVLNSIMAPKEYGYIASGAMGNQASCDAQGFLTMFGLGIGLSYIMNICFYYLAIVTFNKKDNYIRTKIEPWLHGIPILIFLSLYSAAIAINGYNSTGGFCFFSSRNLPHCIGIESGEIRDGFTIPCDRGNGKMHRFVYILQISICLLTPVVIVVTMALMYRTVHKVEKKMQKYGVGSLRFRKKAVNNHVDNNTNGNASARNTGPPPAPRDDEDSGNDSRFSLVQWLKTNYGKIPCMDCCCSSERSKLRSNPIASQKRAILHRAVGFVTAWGLSYIPLMLSANSGVAMEYTRDIFLPLHGIFNFIAYMLPKVRNAKIGHTKRLIRVKQHGGAGNGNHVKNAITWRQAFLKALMSRGPKKTSRHHHARTNRSSNVSWRSNILKMLEKLRTLITAISALSIRRPMNNSNDGVGNINQQQEIHPPVPGSGQEGENIISTTDAPPPPAQHNDDEESSAPALERNAYACSPAFDLSDNADDLKGEEGEASEGSESDSEVHQLNNIIDIESMNNEDMGEGLDGVYLSEEIQLILE